MKTIYLVRHGEYDNPRNIIPGLLPVELSEKGRAQAEELKEYFKDKNVEVIYASAVQRTTQTAKVISDGKITILNDIRIIEVLSAYQGFWETVWDNAYSHIKTLGGESHKNVYDRMVSFFEDVKKMKYENIIICSHGDPIYFLLHYIVGKPLPKEGDEHEPTVLIEYPALASVNEVKIADNGMMSLNQIKL